MGFEDKQLRKLRARLKPQHIKAREADGVTLHYLEGWHVVAEANRIFGFDGWDREMMASQCVWTKQLGSRFAAAYVARVRVTVRAGDSRILREGSGAGEATAPTPGEAHELAAKAAETDATKRALATFGNAFGLSLYGGAPDPVLRNSGLRNTSAESAAQSAIDRPGRLPARIDKSSLSRSEPKRLRDADHLQFVAAQPCMLCGRRPAQAHHLRFSQPHALGRKVSDEFTVPLCNLHHRELHDHGDERAWWINKKLNPLPLARELWNRSHGWAPAPELATQDTSSAELSPDVV
jgi:DNA recombination protein Rad52